jgi:hypothetical protein
MNAAVALAMIAALALGAAVGPEKQPELTVADLAAYRAALAEKSTSSTPAEPVTFRDLWDHPETFKGRRVQVEGRVVRRFRQGSFGTFPPLVEVWAATPSGDLFCLVCPDPGGRTTSPTQGSVRFAGTFLKRVRYQGGDVPRLAPLIVGSRPPVASAGPSAPEPSRPASFTRLDWTIGVAISILVFLILVAQYVRRPTRRPFGRDPPLEFLPPGQAGGTIDDSLDDP